jgi:hypothetical protein
MSDRSVYSGLYQQAREYATLLDTVLMGIKAGISLPTDADRQKLSELFAALDPSANTDLPSRMLALTITDRTHLRSVDWKTIGDQLQHPDVSPQVIATLEEIAGSLERAQATALNRMRS